MRDKLTGTQLRRQIVQSLCLRIDRRPNQMKENFLLRGRETAIWHIEPRYFVLYNSLLTQPYWIKVHALLTYLVVKYSR